MVDRTLSVLMLRRICYLAYILLLTLGCGLPLASAQTQDAGKTLMAKGVVTASDNEAERALKRRSPVFMQDKVATGAVSAAQLRMIDGALLSLQQESELSIASYAFNPANDDGVVQMSLLKGGLRTVTGALQQTGDNYKLTTPVASIGVRGTHYEAELQDGDLFLAAWKGTIDVQVTVGSANPLFSLGPSEAYRFAIVRADGRVEFLLQTPPAFAQGHSNERFIQPESQFAQGPQYAGGSVGTSPSFDMNSIAAVTANSQKYINNDVFAGDWWSYDPLTNARSGEVVFDQIEFASVTSNLGPVTDFSMSMTIDFTSALIPTGNVSFFDDSGEWFAAFNGAVTDSELSISVNFAAHNNIRADGFINGLLIDDGFGVLGSLSLYEQGNDDNFASGSFELRSAR